MSSANFQSLISPTDSVNEAKKETETARAYFLINVYSESRSEFAVEKSRVEKSKKALEDYRGPLPITLISKEKKKPKTAFLLQRGEYDQKGEQVDRDTPAALPPFDKSLPRNRLGLAKWLTSGQHPLTSRVAVNRYWQQVFGTGLVKTSENFGAQGDLPSHPELLDWLATDFVEHGWDVKRLMKQLVMSAAYRQTSVANADLIKLDPENRLLARGPRFRLDAEMLRDQALSISGLLQDKIGGPGVKPPQPDGLWFAVGYSGSNTVRFEKDSGHDKVHRRSLYTFWKRTAPPPQMNTFDAPSREECSVRRERTNTPLQALLLMNDPQYIEAARYFAQSVIDNFESVNESDRIQARGEAILELALGRRATSDEVELLAATFSKFYKQFGNDESAAERLVKIGEVPFDASKYSARELAAWTMIANLVMNMDEFVTKN